MSSTTSRGIQYPTSGDQIAPLETVFATLAQTADTAIGNLVLNTTDIVNYSVSGKNKIVNGAFDHWQRGESRSLPTGTTDNYSADRWHYFGGGALAATVSRVTATLTGFQYALKFQRTAGNTQSGQQFALTQVLETSDSIPLQNKKVTISFWAKKGTDYSQGNFEAIIIQGTGTDQGVSGVINQNWTGHSRTTVVSLTSSQLTASWVKYSGTITLSSSMTEMALQFLTSPTGTAGADDSFYIAGVQMELGSMASAFSRNASSVQGELLTCQRFFYAAMAGDMTSGIGAGSNAFYANFKFPVDMRVRPTFSNNGAQLMISDDYASNYVAATPSTAGMDPQWNNRAIRLGVSGFTGGLTTGRFYSGIANDGASPFKVLLNAEL